MSTFQSKSGWTELPLTEFNNDDNSQDLKVESNMTSAKPIIEENNAMDFSTQNIKKVKQRDIEFRQRIRQNAKQLVEKKRGSAQLARRLSRTHLQQTQSFNQTQNSFDGIDDLDKKIEDSIQLGSKYVKQENTVYPSDQIQHFFFFGKSYNDEEIIYQNNNLLQSEYIEKNLKINHLTDLNKKSAVLDDKIQKNSNINMIYAKSNFPSKENLQRFADMLTTYCRQAILTFNESPINENFEDHFYRMESLFFAKRPLRDYNIFIQRFGTSFLPNNDIIGSENFATNCIEKINLNNENYLDLVEFCKAIEFSKTINCSNTLQFKKFKRLEIDISRIEFDYHWLFSIEDATARHLYNIYKNYSNIIDSLLVAIEKYFNIKSESTTISNEIEGNNANLLILYDEIIKYKQMVFKIGIEMENIWAILKDIRSKAKYSLTNLILNKLPNETNYNIFEQFNEEIPNDIKEVLSISTYILYNNSNDQTKLNNNNLSKIENERIDTLKKCHIQIQIFFNDILVCCTADSHLQINPNGGFSVLFSRIFNLNVIERIESICLKIRERFIGTVNSSWHELAQIFIPISDKFDEKNLFESLINNNNNESSIYNQNEFNLSNKSNQTSQQSLYENESLLAMEFASDLVKAGYKGSLGCGSKQIKQNELLYSVNSFINGKLYCKAKWNDNDNNMENEKEHRDSLLTKSNCINLQNKFNLIPDPVLLVTEDEFQMNLTQQFAQNQSNVLSARQQSLLFKTGRLSITGSGASGSDLFVDDFNITNSFGLMTSTSNISISGAGELSLDAYRRVGHAYAVLIRRNLCENFALESRLKLYSEIVHEESLPTLFRTFGTLFTPPDLSRKLKPMRLLTAPKNLHFNRISYKLVVNIQSANNLPERINGEPTRVFAEVSFQKTKVQTTIVFGRYANWQETLLIDITNLARLNFTQQNFDLKNVTEYLEVNIFDQIVTPLIHDNREQNTLHEQIEYRWLGCIRIPFSTIYSYGKIDGILSLKSPLFLFGYKKSEKQRYANIKMLVTTDPLLTAPQYLSNESFASGETDEKLFNQSKKWERQLRFDFPERRFVALANDSNGKRIIASRFLRKITPPPQIMAVKKLNIYNAVIACAELITSIPFINDPIMYPGVCEIWINADEMLKIGCGGIEEHAILLACWLLGMDLTAYLVLGRGLPEGLSAAYVLVKFDQNYTSSTSDRLWLISAYNGNCYFIDDPTIPFQVGTVVTPYNIYGNICSNNCYPSLLDFNLKKLKNWKPLFSNDKIVLKSVQIKEINYIKVSEDLLTELRLNLEREIKFCLDEARPYGIPQWNLMASRDILHDIWSEFLTESKMNNLFGTNLFSSNSFQQIEMLDLKKKFEILSNSYNIQAVAFRTNYTTKRNLIEEVLKMRTNINCNTNIQQAVAVYAQPFVNQIVLVSVAIAVLIPFNTVPSISILKH